MKLVKLNIGSGGTKKDGFVSIDKYNVNADIQKDCWDTGFEDNTVDYIYSSHMIEHIEPEMFIESLRHWRMILKKGGTLELLCPNALIYVKEWISDVESNNYSKLMGWTIRNVLGWGFSEGMYNRNLFTPELLKIYINKVGGFDIYNCNIQETRVKNKKHLEYRSDGDIHLLATKL